ncbi:MAG: polyhydroxyalkanoate depolymerase [Rhodospirillaceae bacterium]|nr:polyhydroxyalkanoate depolymerase [Rhodospirillaceae bacterium]MBT4045442.1 polyhydroxyalkanoate depolymerase [Rhodospirillaceae bacterium]MBT4688154.1 polyhydroxyalkanoate depolymerase [Rhodospirillaceae bacterium]MBT5081904.1 polyhydroxyalkanoate depolymerase [Rhodospirillaceae bacterium]MBT5523638.1 polyhydroxyalkanoate depolymerase [Rhodospirillaceae bacterium]
MFYHLHEFQKSAIMPFRFAAEASQMFLSHPSNPISYTPAGRALSASLELIEAGTRHYQKPAFGLTSTKIDGKTVPVHEEIVGRLPFCQLKRFVRAGDENGEMGHPRLLIVAPMSGHYATLLRDTVKAMLPDHDVYITDWRNASRVPLREGNFDLDDYVDYLMDFLGLVGPGCHALAVCQPSVPLLAAVSLLSAAGDPRLPTTMTLMGGPIDTRINPTTPNDLAQNHTLEWFERTVIQRVPAPSPGFMRRVYPGFLQLSGFMTMNLDRHVGAHMRLYHNLLKGDGDSADQHRAFYDEYLAVMDLSAEYYLQTIKRVFQEHQLAVGTYHYRDELVDPGAITKCALMTVEGSKDDISGVGQTRAAHGLCSALPDTMREHYEQPDVGHYGVFNGRRWRQEIAPRIKAFITRHTA